MTKKRKKKKAIDRYEGLTKVDLMEENNACHFCGQTYGAEHHHIFGGPNREHSERLGLVVMLCPDCHREGGNGKRAVHKDIQRNLELKEFGQAEFEKVNSHDDFVRIFHRNWL